MPVVSRAACRAHLCPVRHGSDSQRRMRRMDGCRLPTYRVAWDTYLPTASHGIPTCPADGLCAISLAGTGGPFARVEGTSGVAAAERCRAMPKSKGVNGALSVLRVWPKRARARARVRACDGPTQQRTGPAPTGGACVRGGAMFTSAPTAAVDRTSRGVSLGDSRLSVGCENDSVCACGRAWCATQAAHRKERWRVGHVAANG